MKPLKNIIALLTNQCNLACPYCFEERDERRMDLETGKDILTYLHKSADRPGLTFFGGEPMLEWDRLIVPLVLWDEETYQNAARFNMTTNGTLLTEDRLEFLLKHNISFMLSMDGGRETQDSGRPMKSGESGFDRLMKIIPSILWRRPGQVVRSTLTPASCGRFFQDLMFFRETGFQNVAVMPDVFQKWDARTVSSLSSELGKYEDYVIDTFRAGRTPLLFFEYQKAFRRIAGVLAEERAGTRRASPECSGKNQCGFGLRGGASADVDGNLYGCHHVTMNRESPFFIGDVYHGVDEERVKALVSMYNPMKLGGEKCETCPLDRVCNGGCKPNNYHLFGDMHMVPDTFCSWMQCVTDSAYRTACALGDNERFIEAYKTAVLRG